MNVLKVFIILLHASGKFHLVKSDDYLVSLYLPNSDSDTYLKSHLDAVKSFLHGDRFNFIYWSLAKLNVFAYSITLNGAEVDTLKRMADVKFVERVGEMTVASSNMPNYIPFNFVRPETPVLSHEGYCTINYDEYRRHVQKNVTQSVPAIVSGEISYESF